MFVRLSYICDKICVLYDLLCHKSNFDANSNSFVLMFPWKKYCVALMSAMI